MDGPLDTARHQKKRALLDAYATTGNLSVAAALAGTSRKNHYYWLGQDPSYAAAFEESRNSAVDSLEEEARRRAIVGVTEPVFQRGRLVGHIQRYSDTLLIFLLKAARPEIYRERPLPDRRAPISGERPVSSDVTVADLNEAAAVLIEYLRVPEPDPLASR